MAFETTDIAAKVGTEPVNPLKNLGQFAEIQNSLNKNKLFQAQSLAGQYLENATGPDGQPDFGKFTEALKSDPRTAVFAPTILQDVATLRQTGIANQQAQTNLTKSQYNNLRNIAANYGNVSTSSDPVLRAKENQKAAAAAIAKGVSSGMYPADMAAEFMGSGDFSDAIRAATISGEGGAGAQEALAGTPQVVSTPQGTYLQSVNKYQNTVEPMVGKGAFIPNNLSPGQLAEPIDVVDQSTGSKSRHTLGEYLNPNATWKTAERPLVDLGPLSATARAAYGQALGPDINTFEKFAADAPQEKAYLKLMDNSVDQFSTGPQSDFWRQTGELAREYGININSKDINDPVKASETFRKIMPTLLRAQAARLGMSETDTSRLIAQTSLPEGNLTKEGIHRIIGMSQGLADSQMAQGKVWQQEKSKNGPESFGNFRLDWARKMPPSVFMAQYMTPAEVKDMQKGWSNQQKADWQRRYNIAKSQGWLSGDAQ